jgi:type I restriction enzyme, S subunit
MIEGLKPYDSYRAAVLPWAPRLPSHWRTERAKWLFDRMDRAVRPQDDVVTCFRDGMVTLRKHRRLRGFTEAIFEFGYQGIRRGDLVIHAMDAFAGAVGVSDSDGKGTPVYAVCQPCTGIVSHYYAHVVRQMAHSQWILALSRGIRERSTDFRFEMFGKQWLPLPSPDEQTAIVRFLDHASRRIDRFIRAKRKLIALLNEQKQAIIHRAVTRGLDPNVPLNDSGMPWLGEIPAHWELCALRRHWTVVDCKHLTVPFVSEGIRLASVREVRSFELNLARSRKTAATWYGLLIDGGRKPKRGDLIYCRNASVGSVAIVCTDEDFAMGQDVCLIRSAGQNQRFLNYLLHSPFMRMQLELLQVGSTFKRINVADIKALAVVVPPKPEQDSLCGHLDAELQIFNEAIARIEREISLIREYRTRLVADVVTGQLDVREAAARLTADQPEAATEKLASETDQEEDSEPEEISE